MGYPFDDMRVSCLAPLGRALLLALAVPLLGGCFCSQTRVVEPLRAIRPMGLPSGLYAHVGPDGEDLGRRVLVWQEDINAMAFMESRDTPLHRGRMAWFLPLRSFGHYIAQTEPQKTDRWSRPAENDECRYLLTLAKGEYGTLVLYDSDPDRRAELAEMIRGHGLDTTRCQNLRGDPEDIRDFFLEFARSDLPREIGRYVLIKKGAFE